MATVAELSILEVRRLLWVLHMGTGAKDLIHSLMLSKTISREQKWKEDPKWCPYRMPAPQA